MASYFPQSGVNGFVILGNYSLKCDTWLWHAVSNIIPAPAFGSTFVENCVGQKSLQLQISGTWNALFNPFSNGIKLGGAYPCIFGLNNVDIATSLTAYLAEWIQGDAIDGKADFTATLIGDWVFQDFSGGAA